MASLPPPLTTKTPKRRIRTLRGPLLLGAIGAFIGAVVLGVYVTASRQVAQQQETQQPQPRSVPDDVRQQIRRAFPRDYQSTFAEETAHQATAPPDPRSPTQEPMREIPAATYVGTTPKTTPVANTGGETSSTTSASMGTPDPRQPSAAPSAAKPGQGKRPAAQGGAATAKPPREPWSLTTVTEKTITSNNRGSMEQEAPSTTLLQQATWVQAADPTKVLYRTQVLPLQTLIAFSSDVPNSQVALHVMRDVWDRWGQRILIPHNARILGQVSGGQAAYGQEHLEVPVTEIQFPDGTLLEFPGSKLGGRDGQPGMPGEVEVDHHYPQLVLGILGITALSVASKSAAGSSPYAYQENLAQQYASGVAQGINQAGSQILQKLFRPPTITKAAGDEVTAFPIKNVDLSQVPRRIRPRSMER